MKRISLLLLSLAAGCASNSEFRWTSLPINEQTLQEAQRDSRRMTLENGDVLELYRPISVDDALCDEYVCVRKAEIVDMRANVEVRRGGPGLETVAAPVLLPLTIPVWGLIWAGQANYEAQRGSYTYTPPTQAQLQALKDPSRPRPPSAPDFPADRYWIETGLRDASEFVTYHPNPKNPCADVLPADLQTDAQALVWVHDNRIAIRDWVCLGDAAEKLRTRSEPGSLERSLRLHVLREVRGQWGLVHCYGSARLRRILPKHTYADASISQLQVISETLNDDASFVLRDTSTDNCTGPDPDNPVDRASFAAAVNPFSRSDVTPKVSNRPNARD